MRKARGTRITTIEKIVYRWLNEIGVRFVREYRMIGGTADIYCPDFNLAIEVDGSYWHPVGNELDARKDHDRALSLYAILRLREPDVRSGCAEQQLRAALEAERANLGRLDSAYPIKGRTMALRRTAKLRLL